MRIRYWVFLLSFLLSLRGVLQSDEDAAWYIAAKPGYYRFSEEVLREIFDNGGFSMRGEADYRFYGPLAVWVDGGYFQKSGKALGGGEITDIKIGTVTLGLKGIFYINPVIAFYAGAGPRLFMLWVENHSEFVPKHNDRIGVGGGFSGGFWVFPFNCKNVFFDLFADYSIKKIHFHPNGKYPVMFDIKLDGLTLGIGFGGCF